MRKILLFLALLAGCAAPSALTPNGGPVCDGVGKTQVSPLDGMTLLCVPAGAFSMGSDSPEAHPEEQPVHSVTLDAFWIDQSEVTNAMYQSCVKAGACREPQSRWSQTRQGYFGESQYANFPVIYVSWSDAAAYCRWAGRALPTEAQWEKAARGTDGRTYPWGEGIDPSKANYNGSDTTQVGSYPDGRSPYGAEDMAGNAWEFVSDFYAPDYYRVSPASNPGGPESGDANVLRGGSWLVDAGGVRASDRFGYLADYRSAAVGFRCAKW